MVNLDEIPAKLMGLWGVTPTPNDRWTITGQVKHWVENNGDTSQAAFIDAAIEVSEHFLGTVGNDAARAKIVWSFNRTNVGGQALKQYRAALTSLEPEQPPAVTNDTRGNEHNVDTVTLWNNWVAQNYAFWKNSLAKDPANTAIIDQAIADLRKNIPTVDNHTVEEVRKALDTIADEALTQTTTQDQTVLVEESEEETEAERVAREQLEAKEQIRRNKAEFIVWLTDSVTPTKVDQYRAFLGTPREIQDQINAMHEGFVGLFDSRFWQLDEINTLWQRHIVDLADADLRAAMAERERIEQDRLRQQNNNANTSNDEDDPTVTSDPPDSNGVVVPDPTVVVQETDGLSDVAKLILLGLALFI